MQNFVRLIFCENFIFLVRMKVGYEYEHVDLDVWAQSRVNHDVGKSIQ
jgi:hypothetical protein